MGQDGIECSAQLLCEGRRVYVRDVSDKPGASSHLPESDFSHPLAGRSGHL